MNSREIKFRTRVRRKIKDIILTIGSYFIPKKKNYFVFLPVLDRQSFSGNIRSLITYINQYHPEIETKLITQSKRTKLEAESEGIQTIHSKTRKVFWNLLRAKYIFIDAHTEMFMYGRFAFIQLWHGSGFKNVGCMWENSPTREKRRKALYKKVYSKCKIVLATSESDAKKQNLSFQTNRSTITGYPRNDIFFNNQKSINNLKKKYNMEGYKKIITYAPTHRDSKTLDYENKKTIQPFSDSFWRQIQMYLEESNSVFIIKKHPSDNLFQAPKNYPNIFDLTSKASTTEEILQITDLLISDYSSIITDFAITKKPILIYAYDLNQYTKNVRSLYYDIKKVLPKPFIKNEDELLIKIINDAWQNDPITQQSYKDFRSMFHKYLDGHSSKRVMDEVLKL